MTPVRWALLTALAAGCTEAGVQPVVGVRKDCSLAVIATDYATTSVALLNDDGSLCVEPLVHSGSAGVGVVTALSGDVVFPSTPAPDGGVWLIDRYPNGVITRVDPVSGAARQVSVTTGFPSNPQDLLVRPASGTAPERWYVVRGATNPSPGRQPFDGGGDVLVLEAGAPVARVDLGPLASPGFDPKPARLAEVTPGRALVALTHLRRDFVGGGPGRVAAVDLDARLVQGALDLPDATNCGGVVALPGVTRALVVCSGVFAEPPRRAHSALAVIEPTDGAPTLVALWPAEPLVGDALAFGATPLDARRALVLVFGDLATGARDRIAIVDLDEGHAEDLGIASQAFQLGEPLWLEGGRLWVPDANAADPALRLYGLTFDPTIVAPSGAVDPSPATGLPPRHLQRLTIPE